MKKFFEMKVSFNFHEKRSGIVTLKTQERIQGGFKVQCLSVNNSGLVIRRPDFFLSEKEKKLVYFMFGKTDVTQQYRV